MKASILLYKAIRTGSLSLLTLCLLSSAFAGTVGKIAGKVTDSDSGDPVIGAAVMVEGTTIGASADLNGEYYILNVPPGMVNIRVTALGYSTKTVQQIQVISDQTTNLDFKLPPQSLQGEEVVIVAERKLVEADRTFATQTVGSKDIDALPVTSLSQVIELQAGIVDGHFRGGRSGEVLYLVDGVSVTDVYDNSQGTGVDNRSVQELQVISGTFNAEYGNAQSGVVNIVTKEGGNEYHGSFSSEFGDYVSDHRSTFMHIGELSPMAIQDYNLSIDGPVPRVKNLTFYANGRYLTDSGWLYGQRRWNLANPDVGSYFIVPGDNKYVGMNPSIEKFTHVKLTYQATPNIKLSYTNLYNNRIYRDFSNYWKYRPDGNLRRYKTGSNHLLKLNHSLTRSMFYELGFSNSFAGYEHHVYDDPFDSRWIPSQDSIPPYTINFLGDDRARFRRWTQTNNLNGFLQWQATNLHLLKAGFDAKIHNLLYEDINMNWGFTPEGIPYAIIPDVTTLGHDYYKNNPYELSFYLQDKFEVRSLIINAGVRYDYFEPDGRYPADPKDPDINTPLLPGNYPTGHADDPLSVRESYWWKKASAKSAVSPRLGVAYPISDKGVFHFAYGHFVQRPIFERMYANPEWELEQGVGLNTVMGNPNLKMEKTISYEFGFQQQIAEDIALQTSVFSRDIRNLVATDLIVETYKQGTKYSQYINRSFGQVHGITFSLEKRYSNDFSAFLDYTYQIAEGDASDPQNAYNASKGSHPKEPAKQLVPLDWDRHHTINASATYSPPGPNNWGVTIVAKYGSGLPYTPQDRSIQTGFENDGRKPEFYLFDLSAFKAFQLSAKSQTKLLITLNVQNLLDTKNENNVYTDTGRAGYTLARANATPTEWNTLDEFYNDPNYYSRPRMVKLGLKVEY